MLVLTRKEGQTLIVNGVRVTVLGRVGNRVRLGIDGDERQEVYREEIGPLRRTSGDETREQRGEA